MWFFESSFLMKEGLLDKDEFTAIFRIDAIKEIAMK